MTTITSPASGTHLANGADLVVFLTTDGAFINVYFDDGTGGGESLTNGDVSFSSPGNWDFGSVYSNQTVIVRFVSTDGAGTELDAPGSSASYTFAVRPPAGRLRQVAAVAGNRFPGVM